MKLVCKYLHNIPFDEVKDLKVVCQDEDIKFHITIECLYNIFEKQYTKELNDFANTKLREFYKLREF